MPPADDSSTILVCACGKRLKAPGATPGRVGRCPSCGGTLRAPGHVPNAPDREPERAEDHAARPAQTRRARAETSGEPAPVPEVHPTRVGTEIQQPRRAAAAIGREGLVRVPHGAETTLRASLLYPLWDGNGVALLVFLPPVLWLTSLFSIGLVPSYVLDADLATRMGALTLIFPMGVLLAFTLGYLCAFLGGVITSSARGDVHHPRVPPWSFGPILVALFSWLWALAAGMVVSGPLLIAYRFGRESPGSADWLVTALLAAPGVAYAGVALVAVLLHESLVAANPLTVVRALVKSGADAVRLAATLVALAAATLTAAILLFSLPKLGAGAVIVGVWAFWLALLYEGMVVSRILGLFYRRHAEAIGWFPERAQWGA